MMTSIKHEFFIAAEPQRVSEALTSGQMIAKWWTTSAELKPEVGTTGVFKWPGHRWTVEIKLDKIEKNSLVQWKCTASNMQNTNAWVGTTMTFRLTSEDSGTRLSFSHDGYRDSPCKDVCTGGWRFVLGSSLKKLVETGAGQPYSS